MTVAEIEDAVRRKEITLRAAIGAYRAVWDSWPGIDSATVDSCRRAAMSAALGAVEALNETTEIGSK